MLFRSPVFMPKITDVNGVEALQRFLAQHHEIKRVMADSVGYDIMRVKITSPASRLVHIRFGAELDALTCHDMYHWQQIEERRKDSRFP